MTESRITTWQEPDDLWAYRLEAACETCWDESVQKSRGRVRRELHDYRTDLKYEECPTCHGDGTVAHSQHGFRTRKLALVRAKQVIRERSLEPRRHEETIEVEGT